MDVIAGEVPPFAVAVANKHRIDALHHITGIGLAFCRMAMDEMGGTIECESEVGKYTMITLTFPPVVFAAGDGKS